MNIDQLFSIVYSFLAGNQIIAVCIAIAMALFLWKKPWMFLQSIFIFLILLGGLCAFSYLTDSVDTGPGHRYEISTKGHEDLLKE